MGRNNRTSEAGIRFLQKRVALFGLTGASLGAIFLLFRTIVMLTSSWNLLLHPSMILHLVGAFSLFAAWILCRTGVRSKTFIEWVEATSLLASSVAYAGMGLYIPAFAHPEMILVLAMTMGIITRAVFVPSTGKRTAILSSVVGLPIVFVAYLTHHLAPEAFTAAMKELGYSPMAAAITTSVWWLLSVILATLTSRVIYGLREEIREARLLGQYSLEQKLGEGGMGVVYRASHAMLRRPTAIKLLPASKAGEQTIARFEREVRLTARLTHPNTVTVFDYGRTPDGIFYYAMELLEGATLEEMVEHWGPQPEGRVVHVLKAMAGALAEAHEIGLIHRDIKPANVMLCRRGGEVDVPKLLDFGLVKDLERGHTLSLTNTNTLTGTPLYMAPEAIVAPERVDARIDLYALGAVGYYMLTGTHVFGGQTVLEVCSRHLHKEVESPSHRLGKQVDEELSSLVLRCLRKKPEERPQSAIELKQELSLCEGRLQWTGSEARAWWEAHGEELIKSRAEQDNESSEKSIGVDLGRRTDRPPA